MDALTWVDVGVWEENWKRTEIKVSSSIRTKGHGTCPILNLILILSVNVNRTKRRNRVRGRRCGHKNKAVVQTAMATKRSIFVEL
jgi:hypothetical protein